MLETTHDHSIEMIDRLDLFEVDLRLDDRFVNLLLVLESIDVFSGVRVDILERFGEFVVESIDETDDTTSHDDDGGRVVGSGSTFVGIVVIGRFLSNGVLSFLCEIGEENIEIRSSGTPSLDRHVRLCRGVVVEESGDESEQDANSLVRRSGDGEKSFENLGLLSSIGVLQSCLSELYRATNEECTPFVHALRELERAL